MKKINTGPSKIKALLIICLIGAVVSSGVTLWVYSFSRNAAESMGENTVPSIVAAKQIRATLADAHSNAMKAMVTKEKLGGKYWNAYREDLHSLHSQLIDASKNINYGDEERLPLLAIQSNISAYDFTVGGAVSSGSEISVDQFMEANRLMQQKILPASNALNNVNLQQLDSNYSGYTNRINSLMNFMSVVGFVFLAVLIGTQIYLFRKTRRIFNAGLLIATILFSGSLIYSNITLSSVKLKLYTAKHDAFDSLNSLWSARAEAYNANAIESLYLLHNGTGIVQTADTINFNLASERLSGEQKADQEGGESQGYLKDALGNTTFSGEQLAVETALEQWSKYVEIDKKIRNLEYDSKHNEATLLFMGTAAEQSSYAFTEFDTALGETININQSNFDDNINSAFKSLNFFPYVIAVILLLITGVCIQGMKARMDEYRV